jgi:O-antigen/teichoic acid export membrane protein
MNPAATAPASGPANTARPSLKSLALKGSLWTIGGYGFSQALRLGSNIVLTRLLSPQIFGTMALVNVLIQGLRLFTEIGIGSSVIQNKASDEPRFLNTAWTLQIARGIAVSTLCALLSFPLAYFYRDLSLTPLIAASGLSTLILGFSTIHAHTYNKKMMLGWVTFTDVATQVLTVAVTIALAFAWRNVWSLIVGTLVGTVIRVAWGYVVFRGPRLRLDFHKPSARAMIHFGKWITGSTLLTFILLNADRLVLGRILTKAQLGVYAAGYLIPQAVIGLLPMLGGRVIFPLCVQLQDRGPEHLRSRLIRVKLAVMAGLLPALWFLCLFAQTVIRLFDARFHDAGWILRIFAASAAVPVVVLYVGNVLIARGDSYSAMLLNVTRVLAIPPVVALGYWLGGSPGIIVAFAAVPLVNYPQMAWYAHRTGTWSPLIDSIGLALTAFFLALGWRLGL